MTGSIFLAAANAKSIPSEDMYRQHFAMNSSAPHCEQYAAFGSTCKFPLYNRCSACWLIENFFPSTTCWTLYWFIGFSLVEFENIFIKFMNSNNQLSSFNLFSLNFHRAINNASPSFVCRWKCQIFKCFEISRSNESRINECSESPWAIPTRYLLLLRKISAFIFLSLKCMNLARINDR